MTNLGQRLIQAARDANARTRSNTVANDIKSGLVEAIAIAKGEADPSTYRAHTSTEIVARPKASRKPASARVSAKASAKP